MIKRCTNPKCKQPIKNVKEFYASKLCRDGLQSWCKNCVKEDAKEYKKAKRENRSRKKSHREWAIRKFENFNLLKKCSNPECKQPIKGIKKFSKCKTGRDGLSPKCNACLAEKSKHYCKNNIETRAQTSRKYRQSNSEAIKKDSRQYRINNKNKITRYNKEYCQRYPEKMAANNRKRQAIKLNRTPEWANFDKITELYWVAKTLTVRTGIQWVVDHKIPLLGKNVSGLHVENNLQVITASRNTRKSNKFTPIMGVI